MSNKPILICKETGTLVCYAFRKGHVLENTLPLRRMSLRGKNIKRPQTRSGGGGRTKQKKEESLGNREVLIKRKNNAQGAK
jgi:hypothetical protein